MKFKLIIFFDKYKIIIVSILISILIEIFVCNYGFFRTIIVGNNDLPKEYIIDENSIIISNIDEENSNNNSLNPKVILKNSKQYINFDTHSKCNEIEVKVFTTGHLELKRIILNHPNLQINFFRIICIFLGVSFAFKVFDKKIYFKEYNKDSIPQKVFFISNLIFFCLLIFFYIINQFNLKNFFIEINKIIKDDSIILQTESIINGKIKLLEIPSKELKNMENPYDNIKRDELKIDYLYDVAYYNGNYYNYFGIAPIITLILPFRIVTGMYTHTYIFNLIYIFISFFALYLLYDKLINRYIEKITLFNYYLGFYSIIFASNILTLLRGAKYDIVVTCGIAFLLISINLAISVSENSKLKIIKLVLLGITTALIVLSKPNLIVYYVLILFFYLIGLKELDTKQKIKKSLCVIIPLGIFAIVQMFLNYIRFDNIFEFGAKYQLTGFNMNYCMSITFGKIYAGIVEYLFKTPNINPLKFPFVFINTDVSAMSVNEICYENRLIGLIGIPILYGYIIKNVILKKVKDKEFKTFINICLITSILSIIINTCFGGICEVYSIDFKLILAIGAVILLLKWIDCSKNSEDNSKIFLILSVATIIIMIPIGLTTEYNFLLNLYSDTTVFLKNTFEFWN